MNRIRLPWQPLRWLFYDCEICNLIPQKGEENDPDYVYCEGWHDHAHMSISAIATYSNWDDAYRIFSGDRLQDFQKLVNKSDRIIGFNSKSFDDKLCAANEIKIKTSYDLLSEVWLAAGMPEIYTYGITKPGYKLENLAQANLGMGKSGSGELAPKLFQQGKVHAVNSYCMLDVYLSVQILKMGWAEELIDPVSGEKLKLRSLN